MFQHPDIAVRVAEEHRRDLLLSATNRSWPLLVREPAHGQTKTTSPQG